MNKDYTGGQRLVMMYMKLMAGVIIRPTEYARSMGISRQTVYHQLSLLSSMNVPIVQASIGKWTLMQFLDNTI